MRPSWGWSAFTETEGQRDRRTDQLSDRHGLRHALGLDRNGYRPPLVEAQVGRESRMTGPEFARLQGIIEERDTYGRILDSLVEHADQAEQQPTQPSLHGIAAYGTAVLIVALI